MRKTKENGITLIALIITIIVMLILVGVTVSVALNGGLFKTAKDAATGTQVEADRETLQAGVVGALNEALEIPNAITLQNNLPNGWTVEGEGPYIATSPNENSFKVEQDGTIKDIIVRNSTELERYIFGEEGTGRNLEEILSIDNWRFIEPPVEIEYINLSGTSINDNSGNEYDVYIKYEGDIYKFQIIENLDHAILTLPEAGIKLVYETGETNVGKYVQYDGKDWVVLYDDNINGLQMISADILEPNNVYLGYNDPNVVESEVEDIDGDGEISNVEKAIYSYNHAIETLNKKCESLVTDKSKVAKDDKGNYKIRSVGSNPTNPKSENKNLYTSKELETWAEGLGDKKGYSTDENYISDVDRMIALKIEETEGYWLASRFVGKDYFVFFEIRRVDLDGGTINPDYNFPTWRVYSDDPSNPPNNHGCQAGYNTSYGVRPVITLEPGALDGLTGEGTAENPWILQ